MMYFPQTRSVRIVDSVTFIPTTIPISEVLLQDHLKQVASEIVELLKHPLSTTSPSLRAGDERNKALTHLSTIPDNVELLSAQYQKVDNKKMQQTRVLHKNVVTRNKTEQLGESPFHIISHYEKNATPIKI